MDFDKRITDEELVIEAIRRARGRLVPKSNPLAYEKADPLEVADRLLPWSGSQFGSPSPFNRLLESGTIAISGRLLSISDGVILQSTHGLLGSLSLRLAKDTQDWFSADGTSTGWHEEYRQRGDYKLVRLEGMYVGTDGVPGKIVKWIKGNNFIYPFT